MRRECRPGRHELLHVLDGELQLSLLSAEGRIEVALRGGQKVRRDHMRCVSMQTFSARFIPGSLLSTKVVVQGAE